MDKSSRPLARSTPGICCPPCRKSASRLLDVDHGIERALVVRDRVGVLRVGAPGSVNDELVLVGARRELDGRGVDAAFRLVGHLFGRETPLVEHAREIDGLALVGVDGERHVLEGGLLRGGLLGHALGAFLGDSFLGRRLLAALVFHFLID